MIGAHEKWLKLALTADLFQGGFRVKKNVLRVVFLKTGDQWAMVTQRAAREARPSHTSGRVLTPRFLDYEHKNTSRASSLRLLNLIGLTFSLRCAGESYVIESLICMYFLRLI